MLGIHMREMARPERFELPTPWFVGRFELKWIFKSQ